MGVPSLASKRPAATSLPTFSLPPPDIPRIVPDGLTSSGSHSSSSQSSPPGGQHLYYSNHMTGSWPTPGGSQLSGYTYANPNSGPAASGPLAQSPYTRGPPSYGSAPSPSLQHFAARNSSSAPNGESLPAPQSYQDHSVFPGPSGGAGGGLGSPLSSQAQGGHQHSGLARPATSEQSTSGGPAGPQEGGSYRQPPTPTNCYPPTSTPQQSSYPPYPSPVTQQSPVNSPATSSGQIPRGLASIPAMASPLQFSGGRGHHIPPLTSYASYGQIPGPVLSNMHHPGAPLTMVGGMQGVAGYSHHPGLPPHHPHNLYMHHPSGPAHQSDRDRPFKCNQCSHAFNRNHDLKRHKRIHMAIKPFPCLDCDKRFSRKDALKRHRLVKGCGGRSPPEGSGTTAGNERSSSDRGDAVGDDRECSPRVIKRE